MELLGRVNTCDITISTKNNATLHLLKSWISQPLLKIIHIFSWPYLTKFVDVSIYKSKMLFRHFSTKVIFSNTVQGYLAFFWVFVLSNVVFQGRQIRRWWWRRSIQRRRRRSLFRFSPLFKKPSAWVTDKYSFDSLLLSSSKILEHQCQFGQFVPKLLIKEHVTHQEDVKNFW